MAEDAPSEKESRLGAVLVRSGGLALKALQEALDRQKEEPGRRLGEILLEMKAIDGAQLAAALEHQKQAREVSLLGAILVRTAGLPLKTLQEALDRQKEEPDLQLGKILRQMNAIDDAQLAAALEQQKEMRSHR